jgi:replication fork clamp-binding protein CrfC
MNREQILNALAQVNDAIASLNVRLHPPPADPTQAQELESELVALEQSREALEQALANLPPAEQPVAALAMVVREQNDAAIEMSRKVRQHADDIAAMVEPVNGPNEAGGVKKRNKKPKASR